MAVLRTNSIEFVLASLFVSLVLSSILAIIMETRQFRFWTMPNKPWANLYRFSTLGILVVVSYSALSVLLSEGDVISMGKAITGSIAYIALNVLFLGGWYEYILAKKNGAQWSYPIRTLLKSALALSLVALVAFALM